MANSPKKPNNPLRSPGFVDGLAEALNGSGYQITKLAEKAGVTGASVRRVLTKSAASSASTLENVVKAANDLYLKDRPFDFAKAFRPKPDEQ